MDKLSEEKCACKKKEGGLKKGLLYGILPHSFCILFIIFSVLGVAVFSSLLRPILTGRYTFLVLTALSVVLVTVSAAIYLKRNQALSFRGAKKRWKYLSFLYGSVVAVNLAMLYLVFPAVANMNFKNGNLSASVISGNYSLVEFRVNIPCSGHAYLVIDELKNTNGIKGVKFDLPNLFNISYDSKIINEEQILSLQIFKEFLAQKVVN